MPKAKPGYQSCVDKGGRVRTKQLSGNRYMHLCFIGGKSYASGCKHTKKPTKKKSDGYTRKVDRKMKDHGEIDLEKKKIRVNPKKGGVVDTVLHEELHRKHPKMTEKEVRKKAATQEKKMSMAKIRKALKGYEK